MLTFPLRYSWIIYYSKTDCHQRQQRYKNKNKSKSVVNWSKTVPSGDSPEGRQPEVPEPAKVKTNSIEALNQFSIQTFLFCHIHQQQILSKNLTFSFPFKRLRLNQNSFPWQRRTCSPISPTMSLSEPSGDFSPFEGHHLCIKINQ